MFLTYSCGYFLSNTASSECSTHGREAYLRVCSSSILFIIMTTYHTGSLVSLAGSTYIFRLSPFIKVWSRFNSPLLRRRVGYSFPVTPVPSGSVLVGSSPWVVLTVDGCRLSAGCDGSVRPYVLLCGLSLGFRWGFGVHYLS